RQPDLPAKPGNCPAERVNRPTKPGNSAIPHLPLYIPPWQSTDAMTDHCVSCPELFRLSVSGCCFDEHKRRLLPGCRVGAAILLLTQSVMLPRDYIP
ncbi:MAG: hypothetical protein LUE99_06450, partial [Bacteroides sp.]|nr:hypothetical protein [Bacteroides sp.]